VIQPTTIDFETHRIEDMPAKGPCVIWRGPLQSRGYGKRVDGRLAHRVACETAHGPPPSNKHVAAHLCGVRNCVNPAHLRWCLQAENLEDRKIHGTFIEGESCYQAILTEESVRDIRDNNSVSGADMARKYGVHPNTIYSVRKRQSWKHIK
jgi:hypothetical protein